MSTKRIAVSHEGFARDVERISVALNGEAKTVVRAAIACGGVVRQVWPRDEPSSDHIFWPETPLTIMEVVQTPDVAFAEILFIVGSGSAHWVSLGVPDSDYFVRPPTTNTGQFLLRADPVSGTLLGQTMGGWLDIHAFGPLFSWNWYVTQSGVGITEAVADFAVAKDDGTGSPEPGTIKTRRITFIAQVVDNTLTWNAAPWNLEEIKFNQVATCDLKFQPNGMAYGEADTSGNVSEAWSPTPQPTWTVLANLVSGDPPSGAALGTPLALNTLRQWTLSATGDEDKTCVLDVTVTDDFATFGTKRVTMHSKTNTQTSDELTWTATTEEYEEVAAGEPVGFSLVHVPDGRASLEGIAYPAHANYNWHSAAPATLNSIEYEVRVDLVSGIAPQSGSNQLGIWYNAAQAYSWYWQIFQAPFGQDFGSFDVTVVWWYRRVGQASTAIGKTLHLQATGGI